MITTTPNYLELPASDLVATKAFYETNFGWTFTDYGPTYSDTSVSGMEIGITTESTVAAAPANGSQGSVGPLLLLRTEDLDAAHEQLATEGGVIVTAPFDYPGGSRFHFRDPSGNVLGVYQPDPV